MTATSTARKTLKRDKGLHEYGQMMRRMMRAYGKRLVLEDPAELKTLMDLRDELDATIARTARALHDTPDAHGRTFSWGDIGAALGMTRQGAFQRWGK